MRKQEQEISLQLINEVMDKKGLGSAGPRLPNTQAKRHLALSAAAKAVVIALTPGMPPLQRMTILPRGQTMARTLFTPQVIPSPLPGGTKRVFSQSTGTQDRGGGAIHESFVAGMCQCGITPLPCTDILQDYRGQFI